MGSAILICLSLASTAEMIQRYRETGDGSYLQKAEALVPAGDTRTRVLLATFRHEFPFVEREARAAVERNPADVAMWGLLGDALMESGRYEDAGAAYERMTTLRPNQESYNRIAYHRFVTGKGEEALLWMQLAVHAGARKPEHQAWVLTEQAEMLSKLGRKSEANRAIRRALELFPNSHRALAVRARLEHSIPLLQKAIAIVPLPEYVAELALWLEKAGRKNEANLQWKYLETLEKLAAVRGEKANRALAMIYADAGRKLEHALSLVEAEYEARNDVYSHDARAWVLYKMGRLNEAKLWMEKALAYNTPELSFRKHAEAIGLAPPAGPQLETQPASLATFRPAPPTGGPGR